MIESAINAISGVNTAPDRQFKSAQSVMSMKMHSKIRRGCANVPQVITLTTPLKNVTNAMRPVHYVMMHQTTVWSVKMELIVYMTINA